MMILENVRTDGIHLELDADVVVRPTMLHSVVPTSHDSRQQYDSNEINAASVQGLKQNHTFGSGKYVNGRKNIFSDDELEHYKTSLRSLYQTRRENLFKESCHNIASRRKLKCSEKHVNDSTHCSTLEGTDARLSREEAFSLDGLLHKVSTDAQWYNTLLQMLTIQQQNQVMLKKVEGKCRNLYDILLDIKDCISAPTSEIGITDCINLQNSRKNEEQEEQCGKGPHHAASATSRAEHNSVQQAEDLSDPILEKKTEAASKLRSSDGRRSGDGRRASGSFDQNGTDSDITCPLPLVFPMNQLVHQYTIKTTEEDSKNAGLKRWRMRYLNNDFLQRSMRRRRSSVTSPIEYFIMKYLDAWVSHNKKDANSQLREWKNFAYLRVLSLILLACVDTIAAFVLQIFWLDSDFVCTYVIKNVSQNASSTVPGQSTVLLASPSARVEILIFLSVIIFTHLWHMVSHMLQRNTYGRIIGFRYFYSRTVGDSSVLLVHVWTALTILLSILLLIFNYYYCMVEWTDWDPDFGLLDLSWKYRLVKRLHLVVHFIRCVNILGECLRLKGYLRRELQAAVSGNKRRFVDPDANLDLDLTYVFDRLIAMALPCVDGAFYRNDIRDVARFFATRHYGHFRIYNLCEDHEEGGNGNYDPLLLYDQVQKIECKDHNAPTLTALITFCKDAAAWLNADRNNIVAVHCKGGKGRTGTFCSALMLRTGLCRTAEEALQTFANRRTDFRRGGRAFHGVTAPSQIRALQYLEQVQTNHTDYISAKHLMLTKVVMKTMPFHARNFLYITFIIESKGFIVYDHAKASQVIRLDRIFPEKDEWIFDLELEGIVLEGDVYVRFFYFDEKPELPSRPHCELGPGGSTIRYGSLTANMLCFVFFHTAFHDEYIIFKRDQIDGVYDKKPGRFNSEFSLEFSLEANPVAPRAKKPVEIEVVQRTGSCDDKGFPADALPGLRFMHIEKGFQEMMEYLCPRCQTFQFGDIIHDTLCEDPEIRTLIYVVSGNAVLHFRDAEGASPDLAIGAGECFGARNFLLGSHHEEYLNGIIFKEGNVTLSCSSEVVQIRSLSVSGVRGPMPSLIPNCTADISSILFEYVAKTYVKYDSKSLVSYGRKRNMTQDLIRKHKIPVSEAFLFHEPCNVSISLRFDRQEALNVWPATVFCFANNLILKAKGRNFPEILIPLSKIENLRAHKCTVIVIVHKSNICTTAPETKSSLSNLLLTWIDKFSRGHEPRIFDYDDSTSTLWELRMNLRDDYTCLNCKRILLKRISEISENLESLRLDSRKRESKKMLMYLFRQRPDTEYSYLSGREQELLQLLIRNSQILQFRSGETLIRIGAVDRKLYCIYSGSVACTLTDGTVLAKLGPGDLVGEVSFLEGGNRGALAQVEAETDVECICVGYYDIHVLQNCDKEMGAFFFRNLAISSCVKLEQQYDKMLEVRRHRKNRPFFDHSSLKHYLLKANRSPD